MPLATFVFLGFFGSLAFVAEAFLVLFKRKSARRLIAILLVLCFMALLGQSLPFLLPLALMYFFFGMIDALRIPLRIHTTSRLFVATLVLYLTLCVFFLGITMLPVRDVFSPDNILYLNPFLMAFQSVSATLAITTFILMGMLISAFMTLIIKIPKDETTSLTGRS
jgi:hypothetical protein